MCGAMRTAATETMRRAQWRNKQFEKWSRAWRARPPSRPSRTDALVGGRRLAAPSPLARGLSGNATMAAVSTSAAAAAAKRSVKATKGNTRTTAQHTAHSKASLLSAPAWGSGLTEHATSSSLFEVVSAFDALATRHDLHRPPDCTHFCYSPFLWEPMWADAARALASVKRARAGARN